MTERALTRAQERALDLTRNLVVTAGAGSGKTTVLVERYLHVIDSLPALPHEVLAITYTKKAADEMRGRVIERLSARPGGDPREELIRHELTSAPISTIHAFCASILREFAVEAGIDPSFEVLEGTEQKVLLRETIEDFLGERAAAPPGTDEAMETLAGALGRREIALALAHLAERRTVAARWAEDLLGTDDGALLARWSEGAPDLARALDDPAIAAEVDLIRRVAALDIPGADKLAAGARAVAALCGRPLDRRALRDLGLVRGDGEARSFGREGSRKNWKGREDLFDGCRAALGAVAAAVATALRFGVADLDRAAIPVLRALAATFLELLERYRGRKNARSLLDFEDLLALSAALLGDPARAAVRRTLAGRFRAILVDEFQDIDPVQWAVIEKLAAGEDGRLMERRLFAVGDEKQSIYRFRGADVAIFARLRERAPAVALDDCFRSLPELVTFTNALFERIFPAGGPPYEARPGPLVARRAVEAGEGEAGEVEIILRPREGDGAGGDGEGDAAGGFVEAELLARSVRRVLAAGRRPSDVAVLLSRRTHLKLYEEALRRHGVGFLTYGGIGFYEAPEVVDAANVLAFLADERDDIALAGILRSPIGCLTDGALYQVAEAGGDGDGDGGGADGGGGEGDGGGDGGGEGGGGTLFARLLAAIADPSPLEPEDLAAARAAASLLAGLRADAARRPAAELCREAFERSGAMVALARGPRGAQALANLAKLFDLLRSFEERGARGLARLSELIRAMTEQDAVEGEADVSREGEGVRILTVHAAKGLEFPVVIVPECGAPFREDHPAVLFEEGPGGRFEAAIRVADPLEGYAPARTGLRARLEAEARARNEAEMRRLFYVACTRARDRLVLIGTESGATSWLKWTLESGVEPHRLTRASELLSDPALSPDGAGAAGAAGAGAPPDLLPERPAAPLPEPPRAAFLTPSRWKTLRHDPRAFVERVILRLPEPAPVAGLGALRGTVIHRLLELGRDAGERDLGAEVERALVEAGAVESGLADALLPGVRQALAAVAASPLAAEIAAADEVQWERAFALSFPDGSEVEGRLDLMVRSGPRWRVVDWKTDDVAAADVPALAEARGYDLQIALYALAAARILSVPEVDGTLFFTTPGVSLDRRYDRAALDAVSADLARDLARIARGRL